MVIPKPLEQAIKIAFEQAVLHDAVFLELTFRMGLGDFCRHFSSVPQDLAVGGFGFIKEDGTQERFFVHVSGLMDDVIEGNKVSFELERGPKGMNAVRVKKV